MLGNLTKDLMNWKKIISQMLVSGSFALVVLKLIWTIPEKINQPTQKTRCLQTLFHRLLENMKLCMLITKLHCSLVIDGFKNIFTCKGKHEKEYTILKFSFQLMLVRIQDFYSSHYLCQSFTLL